MTRSMHFYQILAVIGFLALTGCRTYDGDQYLLDDEADARGQEPVVDRVIVETESGGQPVAKQKASVGLRGDDKFSKEDAVPEAMPSESSEKPAEKSVASTTKKSVGESAQVSVKEISAEEAKVSESKSEVPASPFDGTVVIVNLKKKFVVVDFGKGEMPSVKSELGVYRDDQFVGSIRVTEPTKAPLATADIVQGVVRRGDSIR